MRWSSEPGKMRPWGYVRRNFILAPLAAFRPFSEPTLELFSLTSPRFLPPLPPSALVGGLVPSSSCWPVLGVLSSSQFCSPTEALLPASCPGQSVFSPQARGHACFSSGLRSCASQTYNTAVKISGSGRRVTQWAPCLPADIASEHVPSLCRWGMPRRDPSPLGFWTLWGGRG